MRREHQNGSRTTGHPRAHAGVAGRWARTDYARSAEDTACALLGQRLVRRCDGQRIAGLIVETEAYVGPEDRASHARGGLRSKRNASMWAAPGTSYVYFTYGMHHCLNIACWREDHPAAVLIRAVVLVEGAELARANRLAASRAARTIRDIELANGPAKLCQAYRLTLEHDGLDMTSSDQLWVEHGVGVDPALVRATPRIGIANAGEWTDKPLRFVVDPADVLGTT
jgi:DNA-3-methyladenine glycosylase